jgi:hypothetical protein
MHDPMDNEIDELMGNIGALMENLNSRDLVNQERMAV